MVYATTESGLNPACPSLFFSSFSNIVPILSLKISQNVLPTVLNSIIPQSFPGSTLSPFLNKFTTTPFLHPLRAYSCSHIQLYNVTIMVSIPSPPYFIERSGGGGEMRWRGGGRGREGAGGVNADCCSRDDTGIGEKGCCFFVSPCSTCWVSLAAHNLVLGVMVIVFTYQYLVRLKNLLFKSVGGYGQTNTNSRN